MVEQPIRNRQVVGSTPTLGSRSPWYVPEKSLYKTFRTDGLRPWAKRVIQGLQGLFLQIDITEIIVHKADQPDTVMCGLDAPAEFA